LDRVSVVTTSGGGGWMVIEKVSVSVARISSLTWIVNVNVPSVLGVPKISPVLDAKSNSFVPSGRLPSTTLNDGSFCELEHPSPR
jgi:hypothetical protein